MKDIVIIANFCRDFSENDNGRFMYLCKELSKENKVEIITSDYSHSLKKHKETITVKWPFKITFLHEPGYKKNISIQRFMSHMAWGKEVGKYLQKRNRPDVVYCAVPSLTAPLKALEYCKNNNVKYIIDIQDLWPEAFQMVFDIPIISNILFIPFKRIADKIYSEADEICAVSKTYVERALSVNRNVTKGHTVFLGTRLETFDEGTKKKSKVDKICDELWLGYCGSLTASYDIPCVIDALSILQNKGIRVPRFIVMGDGAKRKDFSSYATEKKVSTIFTGKLAYDQMCAVLSKCDLVVNPIKKGSAASIINKHGDYASSGLPVINNQDSFEYRELVDSYHMGLNCENGNAFDMADKIRYLLENDEERKIMGINARKCAEEQFDRKNTYKELLDCILE